MAATYSSLVGLAVGGKYEVRRILGIGGMGVVCEAVHLDLGKRVAIKLIDKSMKESELIVARFRREGIALGKIQSEHIVDVFDVGADPRVGLYMVMEHLPGEDLQTRLDREKRLDVTTGIMIAHQMASGLDKAHAAGVIHRDLKPANVFLTKRDNGSLLVKILDFGVSKVLGELDTSRITGSGAPIGTPLYMSPEQAEGKDDTDGRADIWSMGAVIYEALAGAPPFADRGSYHGTIVGILTSRAKLLHDVAPWVPTEIASVVDAMLVHDRDARIKDAATVTKRLLTAYPAVLPDGTGRHTAVIVPTTAAVDATGDTEIFTSAAFEGAKAQRGSRTSGSGDAEDSKRTLASSPGVSSEAKRTAAATPIEMGTRASSQPPSSDSAGDYARTSRPKTDPMPWRTSASSSANGVAMPGTPPLIDPLPDVREVAPDTQRDTSLALRAERRRKVTLGLVGLAIAAVAAGGYVAGRRGREAPAAARGGETASVTATQFLDRMAPPSAAVVAEPVASASVAASASAGPSASAAPSAMPASSASAAPRKRRPLRRVAPAASAPKPEGATEATPPREEATPTPREEGPTEPETQP